MIRSLRSLLAPAFAVLALGLTTSTQAAFMVNGTVTGTSANAPSQFTFTGLNATVLANPNPTFPVGYNFLNITYNSNAPDQTTTFTVTERFDVMNNQVSNQSGSFSADFTFRFQIAGGNGNLTLVSTTFPAGSTQFGVTFGSVSPGYPTITPLQQGVTTGGNLSTTVQGLNQATVPEPASVVLLGLGLVGTAGFAARRRSA